MSPTSHHLARLGRLGSLDEFTAEQSLNVCGNVSAESISERGNNSKQQLNWFDKLDGHKEKESETSIHGQEISRASLVSAPSLATA
jgi:hypothetical protein